MCDEYNDVLQRLNSDNHQESNQTNETHDANVAIPNNPIAFGELQPEYVGLDFFGLTGFE